MKSINEVIQSVTPAQQSVCGTHAANHSINCDGRKELPERVVDRLFLKFKLLYGHRWSSLFSSDAVIHAYKNQWGKALSGLTTQEIASAVDLIEQGKTEFIKFPPNVLEFRKLCRPNRPAYHQEYQLLNHKVKSGSEVAANYIKKIREVLKNAKTPS